MTKRSVKLLDPQLNDNVLGFLNSLAKNFWRKKFSREEIFHELVLDCENLCLVEISRYIVYLHVLVCETYTHVFYNSYLYAFYFCRFHVQLALIQAH